MSDELTLKQNKAIAELMIQPTLIEVAKKVGISYKTLHRWLNDPVFNQEYKRMRDKSVECAFSKIQNLTSKSVDVLKDIIGDETTGAGIRLNAVKIILDFAIRARDNDFASRIEELEQIMRTGKGTVHHLE